MKKLELKECDVTLLKSDEMLQLDGGAFSWSDFWDGFKTAIAPVAAILVALWK